MSPQITNIKHPGIRCREKQEEKRKQREADWTQTEVKDFSADISPFLGAPSGPRGPAALLKSTDSPFKYFQLFFDNKTLDTLVLNTRHYANLSGVGTEKKVPSRIRKLHG